jgi:hypothetical protein
MNEQISICKYCGKPIERGGVWNPDKNGNGYHHACITNLQIDENIKRVKRLVQNTVLDKIIAEIIEEKDLAYSDFERYKVECLGVDAEYAEDELPQDDFRYGLARAIEIINKYKAENDKEVEE